MNLNLCFIIACKVYENYKSYIPFYVSKINEYYPGSLIILVDNNSNYKKVYDEVTHNENVILLENTSDAKFEIGAYKFATEYIIKNKLHFDYYICSQDTFVLVNKYDFNILVNNNINACPFGHFPWEFVCDLHRNVLSSVNLYDPNEKFLGCWCCSYVCNHNSLIFINNLLKDVKPTIRRESEETERYMGKLLKMLNNNNTFSINNRIYDGSDYDVRNIDITSNFAKNLKYYFIKNAQQKNENT